MTPEETLKEIKKMCVSNGVDPRPSFLFNPEEREDPFSVLIAAILSHQTKDAQTSAAHESLFRAFPTPEAISRASTKKIDFLIRGVGFHAKKAKAMKAIATVVADSGMPQTVNSLMALPMVGRKTAACVEVYGYGRQAIPVDTHVHRISNRIGLVTTKTADETESALKKIFPKRIWKEINYFMVRFGQSTCLPVRPKCNECSLVECRYRSSSSGGGLALNGLKKD
jgi:endonuclease-3